MTFTVAGRYQRLEKLADGGSGAIYRAIDQRTGTEVALKCFHVHRAFDPALLPALRDAQTLAHQLGAKVLVPLLDVGADDDDSPYVTMPLLRGETLATRKQKALSASEARRIEALLEHAVEALRGAGFTHGDLSAENVFVLHEGSIVLLDHESLGRVGAPRPLRHTEGTPELAPGMREASDDLEALAALRAELAAHTRPNTLKTYRYIIAICLILGLIVLIAVLTSR